MGEKRQTSDIDSQEEDLELEQDGKEDAGSDPFEKAFPQNWDEQENDNKLALAGGRGELAATGLSGLFLAATAVSFISDAGENNASEGEKKDADESQRQNEQARDGGSDAIDPLKDALSQGEKLLREKTGTLESTYKILRELGQELSKGGRLEGQRLEKVRNGLRDLMHLDPALKPLLEPFAKQLKVPDITGRTDQITNDLNSPSEDTRAAARRAEIDRLMKLPRQTEADKVELERLRRAHFDGMKSDHESFLAVRKELPGLYDKQDRGELSAKDTERLAALEKSYTELSARKTANLDFTVKMLKAEAQLHTSVSSKGGSATQGMIMKMFDQELKRQGLRDLEVIPLTGGAMDDAGADFILLNKKTGDFMFIDPTQEPKGSERKARLPELRQQGIISSDPYDAKYTGGDKNNVGTPQYNARREADIRNQIQEILRIAKDSALNIAEIYIPSSKEGGLQSSSKGKEERMRQISELPPDQKALAIRDWREELRERQKGLNEMIPLAREKAEKLRAEAKTESDPQKQATLRRQAQLLEDWHQHTDGSSRTLRQGSPLIFINKTLQDLDAMERTLPEKYKPLARESQRPGSSYEAPKDMGYKLNQAANDLRDMISILTGKKEGGAKEVAAALERLVSFYGEQSQEGKQLLDLREKLKAERAAAPAAPVSEPGSKPLYEKLPERMKKALPQEYSPDVKDALAEVLESNRSKWNAQYVQEMEQLLKDYESGKKEACQRVNRMLSEGRSAVGASTGTAGAPAAAERPAGGNAGGERPAETAERFTTTELNPAQEANQRAIETLTCPDGVKYIDSIPIGELTVARVEEKLKNIDKEIERAKERGLVEYAEQLEKIKKEYESKKTAPEREAYCREMHERMKEAHERAASCGKGKGANLAGKAGTVVALLMVAGWVLDVTAPAAVAKPAGPRVLPSKR